MHKDDIAAMVGAMLVLIGRTTELQDRCVRALGMIQKQTEIIGDLIEVTHKLKGEVEELKK